MANFSAFRQNRLGTRLLGGVLVISGILAFLISALQLSIEYEHDLDRVSQRLLQVKHSTGDTLTAAAWQFDQSLMELQMRGILQLPDIVYIALEAEGVGSILLGENPEPRLAMSYNFPLVHVQDGVTNTIGSVTVVASREHALSRLWSRVGVEVLSQFVKTLIVSILLLVFFRYLVTRRMSQLTAKAGKLSLDNLSIPIALKRLRLFSRTTDELDDFADHLDSVRRSLAKEVDERIKAESALEHTRERFRLAMQGANDGLWDWNLVDDTVFYSERWCDMLGYQKEEVPASTDFWLQHVDQRDRDVVQKQLDLYLNKEIDSFSVQYRINHKAGHLVWVLSRGFVVRDERDVATRFIGTAVDVTNTVLAENTIKKLSTAMLNSPVAVAICDDALKLEYYNPLFARSIGLGEHSAINDSVLDLLLDSNLESDDQHPLSRALLLRREWQGEMQLKNQAGELRWQAVKVSFVKGHLEDHSGFLILLEDITERKKYEQQLAHQANYDALTKLPNRVLAANRLQKALAKARRDQAYVGIIFFDLDQFKLINDSLGHEAGDELLIQVAGRLKHCIREDETIARFGGDEFLMVLPDIKDPLDCESVAARIMEVLSKPFNLDERNVFVTASLGISVFPQDGESAEVLIQHADTAMYKSKEVGRSTFHFFTQRLNQEAQRQLVIETELRLAIERKELDVYFQPIFDCHQGKIVGAEALMRWKNQNLGDIPTNKFIEVAEKSALIHKLDDWVIDSSCSALRGMLDRGSFDGFVAVNVSSRELQRESLVAKVKNTLRVHDLAPESLHLELTERSIINARSSTLAQLNELQQIGVHLAIDDFGTGYSALGYLLNLPFSVVKIDRSFIGDVPNNVRHTALVSSVIDMVHNLGMKVLAEGVESVEQYDCLQQAGCDFVQGYYIARPTPVDQFEALILSPESSTGN